jgi:hypothetical protein
MTRSSIVAAVVVTLLLGLLIWWRDEHPHVARVTAALTPPSETMPRAAGKVTVVPAARSAPPAPDSPSSAPVGVPRPYEPLPTAAQAAERRPATGERGTASPSQRASDDAGTPSSR